VWCSCSWYAHASTPLLWNNVAAAQRLCQGGAFAARFGHHHHHSLRRHTLVALPCISVLLQDYVWHHSLSLRLMRTPRCDIAFTVAHRRHNPELELRP